MTTDEKFDLIINDVSAGGMAAVFPYICLVDSRRQLNSRKGFVYGSENSKFSSGLLISIMKEEGMFNGVWLFNQAQRPLGLDRVVPYSLSNMETLLSGNIWRLKAKLGRKKSSNSSTRPLWNSRLIRRIRSELEH